MSEKQRKDEQYLQDEQEKMERKAATELQKQKKEEAEQEALAGAALNKIKKNQGEFAIVFDLIQAKGALQHAR